MSGWHWSGAATAFILLTTPNGFAAEQVGEAVLIKTTVTGDGGTLVKRSPVHRDERIRTSNSGLGEFIFQDGTKFAIGGNSSVVIDDFVYNSNKTVENLTINAARGSFRWISGKSRSSAYKINTPSGTIGIRGTALDIFVGAGGKTAVVLLQGQARFCGSNGCQELRRRCDVVVATPRGGVTRPERVSRDTIAELGTPRALPFLSGHQRLSNRFRVRGGCQVADARPKSGAAPTRAEQSPSTPNTPSPPNNPGTPSTPNTPSTPSTPSIPSKPNPPSKPSTPNTPNKPSTSNTSAPRSSTSQGQKGFDGYSNYGNYGNQGRGNYGNYGGGRGNSGGGGGEGPC